MANTKRLDMTQGPILKKLLIFVIPAILTNLMQQLYAIADRVVVGRFAQDGTVALAAVGSTSSASAMFLNVFIGMAVGVNVVCANFRGARDEKNVDRCMHTAIPLGFICGVFVLLFGELCCRPLLSLLGTPDSLMEGAELYMRIFFLGVPASLVYNFASNILRANGDTKRPMMILGISGLVNVALNLVLVIGLGMSVAGVAVATITAQYISAVWVLWILFSKKGDYRMSFKKLRLHGDMVWSITKIGVPGGINGLVFTFSNTVILTGVNSFNSEVISAGKTAATDLSLLIYQVVVGIYMGCISFAGQCYGARKYRRIDQVALTATGLGVAMLAVIGVLLTVFERPMLGLFNSDPEVIRAGIGPLRLNAWFYVVYLISEIPLGCMRGAKRSTIPSFLNVIGICGPRIIWSLLVFPAYRGMFALASDALTFLFVCYPISWCVSAILQWIYYFIIRSKLLKSEDMVA